MYQKHWREQAVERASTPFLNRKQDNQSHCFDLGPYGVPYNSCNPLNSTQLKHNTRKSKGVLQLNIRDNLGWSSCASYSLGPGPFSGTIQSPRRCHRAGRNTALRNFSFTSHAFWSHHGGAGSVRPRHAWSAFTVNITEDCTGSRV